MTTFDAARRKMVDGQVRPSDVTDLRIIDAMNDVPREAFVPAAKQGLAYLDLDIEVSSGSGPKRHLIKPVVLARLIQAAAIGPNDRALVVGCATGYSAAIVGRLAATVVATESDPTLVAVAQATLERLGASNVRLVTAPAMTGEPAQAPYDVIVLDGATEVNPTDLYGQLAPAGRLVGVFASVQPPRAEIVTRSQAEFGNRAIFDAYAPVLPGMERPAAFTF